MRMCLSECAELVYEYRCLSTSGCTEMNALSLCHECTHAHAAAHKQLRYFNPSNSFRRSNTCTPKQHKNVRANNSSYTHGTVKAGGFELIVLLCSHFYWYKMGFYLCVRRETDLETEREVMERLEM